VSDSCEHGNEPYGSIKGGKILAERLPASIGLLCPIELISFKREWKDKSINRQTRTSMWAVFTSYGARLDKYYVTQYSDEVGLMFVLCVFWTERNPPLGKWETLHFVPRGHNTTTVACSQVGSHQWRAAKLHYISGVQPSWITSVVCSQVGSRQWRATKLRYISGVQASCITCHRSYH
jgi:hypothetical protein